MEGVWNLSHLIPLAFLWTGAAFIAILSLKLLAAGFEAGGLLSGEPDGQAQPERIVALVTTVAACAALVGESLSTLSADTMRLAEPNELLVWLAGGGQLSYLIGKSRRLA